MIRDDLLRVYWFGGGGYSAPAPRTAPTEDSPEVKAAAEEAARQEMAAAGKRKGRLSTILTGSQGLTDQAPTKRPTLFGQVLSGSRELGQ